MSETPNEKETFDLVVLGGGSAAEELCSALAEDREKAPARVAVVERDLVGGECPYRACMPSKAMLRSAAVRRLLADSHRLGASTSPGGTDSNKSAYAAAAKRRDEVAERHDDCEHVAELERAGVELVRGEGRITGPGRLQVNLEDDATRELGWKTLVIATGSRASMPPIEGLESVSPWTSDDALQHDELPESLAILGGGPVGCELAEIYAGFLAEQAKEGSRTHSSVVLIESSDRLVDREEPILGELLAEHLRRLGVEVRTAVEVNRVEKKGKEALLSFSDGTALSVSRVLVTTGREPATAGLGLDSLGVELDDSGAIRVDEHCRVVGATEQLGEARVFAAGDVNGIAPFTHAAKYQARVIAAVLMGEEARTDDRAIPRCVYTDPPLAATGLTRAGAEEAGIDVVVAELDLSETARAQSDGLLLGGDESSEVTGSVTGRLMLIADRSRSVLVGASAFGPHADEWLSEMTLAIRTEVPLTMLVDVVHPFPTYAEALEPAIRGLLRQCR